MAATLTAPDTTDQCLERGNAAWAELRRIADTLPQDEQDEARDVLEDISDRVLSVWAKSLLQVGPAQQRRSTDLVVSGLRKAADTLRSRGEMSRQRERQAAQAPAIAQRVIALQLPPINVTLPPIYLQLPPLDNYDIEPIRDPQTGLTKRFRRVPRES